MTKFVLVLSYHSDSTALRVMQAIKELQYPVLLLDTADFPCSLQLQGRIEQGKWQGCFQYGEERYNLHDIQSIYVRRPRHYTAQPDLPEVVQQFQVNEANKGFGGMFRSLDCLWVNDLDAKRRASFKPLQLQIAAEVGMHVPRTLITNEPAAVLDFFDACHGEMITKTLHGNYFAGGDETYYLIHTNKVRREHLQGIDRVRQTAHLFQEYIPNALEIRATVVGNHVLSVGIASQHAEGSSIVDWRASYKDVRYQRHTLPSHVQQYCIAITQRLGLVFGAIDLILTPDGDYVFLEINAGGQWEWLEVETGLPFSRTFAEILIEGKEGICI
jgi:glutathione synthase/RimK-type ligase-like ATP-grasp enzyme